jgi:membrane protease YdiL (CAAX protease family)
MMKTLIRVVSFYAITFLFTIVLSIVQQATGIDAGKIVLPQFGPGLAALAMMVLFRRDDWKPAISIRQIPFRKYLGALGIPVLASIILFLIYTRVISPLSVPLADVTSLALMLGGMVLGAFGEELGWRGYLQNLLDERLNGFAAFVLVGILWGLWHVGNYLNGPTYMLFFVLFTVGCSGVMAWLLRGTDYNVVLASLFHFAVNAGFYLLKDALADMRLIALNGIVWMSAAAILVAFRRKEFLRFRNESADANLQNG